MQSFLIIYRNQLLDLSSVKKLAVIRLSSLGDVLLTTPLIRSIKKSYPQIKIEFVTKEQYKDLLIHNPYLSKIYPYKTDDYNYKILFLNELRKQNYDMVIDLQKNLRSREIVGTLKVETATFNKRSLEKFLLVKFKINKLKNAPQIPVRYAEDIDDFNLDDEGLDLFLPAEISSSLSRSDNYIGIAPGSRHFTKMWPTEYFIEFGKILIKEGYKVVLLGGTEDKEICTEISDAVEGSINLCNEDKLFQTAADMKKCSVLICNDSGLMHVGCALKVPVLVIFGSTVKEFGFTPYKNKNLVIENNSLSCRPCSHVGRSSCPKRHFKCMTEIKPAAVFDKLKILLNS